MERPECFPSSIIFGRLAVPEEAFLEATERVSLTRWYLQADPVLPFVGCGRSQLPPVVRSGSMDRPARR